MGTIETYLEEKLNSIITIYCDLDEVLTDFDRSTEPLLKPGDKKEDGSYWINLRSVGLSFWADMHWMPDGKILWQYIVKYDPIIMSAHVNDENSKRGKRIWIRRELGPEFEQTALIVRKIEKPNYARAGTLLIDDNEDTVFKFKRAGGDAILHLSANETIRELKKRGL